MRVQNETHRLAKFIAFVMSFAVIGASDALADGVDYQMGPSHTVDYSLNYGSTQLDMGISRVQGVEYALNSVDAKGWRVGLGVSNNQYVVQAPQKDRAYMLYFRTNLSY